MLALTQAKSWKQRMLFVNIMVGTLEKTLEKTLSLSKSSLYHAAALMASSAVMRLTKKKEWVVH